MAEGDISWVSPATGARVTAADAASSGDISWGWGSSAADRV
ncbi:hypothetical protein [Streptomyces sp. NBC_01304]|nr:hypothetical protein OG430_23800 [Streptomyces sp. NBC_01304]